MGAFVVLTLIAGLVIVWQATGDDDGWTRDRSRF